MTDFFHAIFTGDFLFALCICLTVQVAVAGPYTDPNEQPLSDIVVTVDTDESIVNPHGNSAMCTSCHTSDDGRRDAFVNGADISQLCQSCHDGKLAMKDIHPVDVVPSDSAEMNIPSDLPLTDGRITCLSCHDIASKCKTAEPDVGSNRNFLRQGDGSRPLEFCVRCHQAQEYQPFNVHDQLEAENIKEDTCLWCHTSVPEVSHKYKEDASYALRGNAYGVCNNCHRMADEHPNNEPHMYSVPPEEMMWCMSTYEMMPRMRVPFKTLFSYIKGAKRSPRSIPLDKSNRIACYSCHNPHEKGLFPDSNPRSLGAEPKQASNSRLRARQGNICQVCHNK